VSASDATVTFHPPFVIGSVDSRLVGSFVEHLGRRVYTGLYELGHSMADDASFRTDVAELTRELGVHLVPRMGEASIGSTDVGAAVASALMR